MSLTKPKSWIGFLAGTGIAFLLFVPMAVLGLAYERIPFFLTGLGGAGIFWLVAAFMGLRLATGLHEGRYRNLQPLPWRDQVW